MRYEEQLRWHLNDHDWHFEAMVMYDQMAGVDEAIVNGKKMKVRGTRDTAARAVAETLRAADYYASQRHRIAGALAFAGQGIGPDQYVNDCVIPMRRLMQPGDWFSFGGFCIIGRHRSLIPVFHETFDRVLDVLIPHGITRYHLLGVCAPQAVEYAAAEAERRGIVLSTDSSAPEFSALFKGARYEGGTYKDTEWTPADKHVKYCPVDLAHDNIVDYSAYALSLGGNGADLALDETERTALQWAYSRGLDPITLAPICEGASA